MPLPTRSNLVSTGVQKPPCRKTDHPEPIYVDPRLLSFCPGSSHSMGESSFLHHRSSSFTPSGRVSFGSALRACCPWSLSPFTRTWSLHSRSLHCEEEHEVAWLSLAFSVLRATSTSYEDDSEQPRVIRQDCRFNIPRFAIQDVSTLPHPWRVESLMSTRIIQTFGPCISLSMLPTPFRRIYSLANHAVSAADTTIDDGDRFICELDS